MTRPRTPRTCISEIERRFLDHLTTGLRPSAAAVKAGYSPSFAEKAESRILNRPLVRAEWQKIQTVARERSGYTLEAAMAEAADAAEFAKTHKNPMAYVKAVDLRARISGLMVERIEQVPPINLRQALEDAKARVLNITPPRRELDTTVSLPGPTPSSRGPSMNE